MNDKYIIDFNTKQSYKFNNISNIESKIIKKNNLTNEEISELLNYVIFNTRNIINDDTYENKCDLAQAIICNYFNKLNIVNYPNMTQKSITSNIIGHSFVVATFNGTQSYIIDPTYIQFLTKSGCDKNNFLIINNKIIKTPDPGCFIKEEDKNVIKDFIIYGYMDLNDKNSFIYGNSFYHTKVGISPSIDIGNISGQAFKKSFLKGNEKLSEYDDIDIPLSINKERIK